MPTCCWRLCWRRRSSRQPQRAAACSAWPLPCGLSRPHSRAAAAAAPLGGKRRRQRQVNNGLLTHEFEPFWVIVYVTVNARIN